MPTGVYQRQPRVERVEIACTVCSSVVRLRPSEAEARSGLYCSRACAATAQRTFDPARKCATCGGGIRQDARADAQYCSRKCQGVSRQVAGSKWSNPDYVRTYGKEYRQRNAARLVEQAAKWANANPEKRKAIASNYAHRQRAAGKVGLKRALATANSSVTPDDVRGLFAKAQHKCVYCGAQTRTFTMDHVEPISRGGKHRRGNLIPCCKPCNSSKGAKEVADWLHRKHGVYGLARALIFLTRQKIELGLYPGEVA